MRTIMSALTVVLLAIALMPMASMATDATPTELPSTSDSNKASYWEPYADALIAPLTGSVCEKIDDDGSEEGNFVMPAEATDTSWVVLILKQGQTDYVYDFPVAGHEYIAKADDGGWSHVIVCSVVEPEDNGTTTTTVDDTTTTTVDDTTTTTTVDETTTTVEDSTTTTVAESTTTTVGAAETTTTSGVLPFTGADTGLLALSAIALLALGAAVLKMGRGIDELEDTL